MFNEWWQWSVSDAENNKIVNILHFFKGFKYFAILGGRTKSKKIKELMDFGLVIKIFCILEEIIPAPLSLFDMNISTEQSFSLDQLDKTEPQESE